MFDQYIPESQAIRVVVGNKIDLLGAEKPFVRNFQQRHFHSSAKEKVNVSEVFEYLAQECMKAELTAAVPDATRAPEPLKPQSVRSGCCQ